jgi:hypothetical protein
MGHHRTEKEPTMRKPSASQQIVLNTMAAAGGVAVPASTLNPVHLRQRTNTMVALDKAGWITVDRGTPDNRGGNPDDYRYSLTEAGWIAAGYDAAVTGDARSGAAWAVARRGAELTFAADNGQPPTVDTSTKGIPGATDAFRALVDAMTGCPQLERRQATGESRRDR